MRFRRLLPIACLVALATLAAAQDKKKKDKAKVDRNKEVQISDVRLGKTLLGKVGDMQGRVVLLEFWGRHSALSLESLPRMSALSGELSPFGLLVVGAHAERGKRAEAEVISAARSRGVNFPIVLEAGVTDAIEVKALPHCLVFDHKGQCLYQGPPVGAEGKARAAVVSALIDAVGTPAPTGSVGSLMTALKRGSPPAQVLRRAVHLLKSSEKATAENAERLVTSLTARGTKQLEEAEKLKDTDVVQAHEVATGVATAFKGSPVGTKASALAAELKRSPKMAAEVKARPQLEAIRKIDATLSARAGDKFDPKSPEFQKVNAVLIRQLHHKLEAMKRSAADTVALSRAAEIAGKYGVE